MKSNLQFNKRLVHKLSKVKVIILMALLIFMPLSQCIQVEAGTVAPTSSPTSTGTTGNAIKDSKLGKGMEKMFADGKAYLLFLSPTIGGAFALYFLARKNAADEQDQKAWNKRLMITGICVAGALLVTVGIEIINTYFG